MVLILFDILEGVSYVGLEHWFSGCFLGGGGGCAHPRRHAKNPLPTRCPPTPSCPDTPPKTHATVGINSGTSEGLRSGIGIGVDRGECVFSEDDANFATFRAYLKFPEREFGRGVEETEPDTFVIRPSQNTSASAINLASMCIVIISEVVSKNDQNHANHKIRRTILNATPINASVALKIYPPLFFA